MALEHLAGQVRHMEPWSFWLLAGGLAAAGGLSFYLVWRYLRRARIIADTPTSKVRSAAQGYVELDGRGEHFDDGPAVSPGSGRRCLWYRYKLERKEHYWDGDERRTRWETVQKGESDSPFFLNDGTGRVEVHPEGAEVTTPHRRVWYTRTSDPRASTASLRIGGMGLNLGGSYRHTEEILVAGPLYALGWFTTLSHQTRPLEPAVRERLETWQEAEEVFMDQFDRNEDGRLDAEERQRARDLAQARVLAEEGGGEETPPSFHTLTAPEGGRQPFLVTGHSQAALIRRYRRRSLGALVGLAVLTAAVLWVLTARF